MNKACFLLSLTLLICASSISAKQKPGNFSIFSSPVFSVRYPDTVTAGEVSETAALFMQAFTKLSTEYSFHPSRKPEIILYGTVLDFINATGNPGWHGGVTRGNNIFLEPPSILKDKGVLKTTVFHEAAHYFISDVTHGNCPAWLQEGFAAYFSGELNDAKSNKTRRFSSFDEISHAVTQRKSRSFAASAYLKSSIMTRLLIHQYGYVKLLLAFRFLGQGNSFSSACKKSFDVSPARLFEILSAGSK